MTGRAISPAGEAPYLKLQGVPSPVEPGQIVAGKYRIERIIGSGGMGVILGATHLQLEQPIAIKFMSRDLIASQEAVRRFVQEARAAARIKSEHVARVYDVASHDDGTPYIVMEYLEGRDLDQILAERRVLPVAEAAEYVLQACEALAEAHMAGIVHRDLKPGNLFRCTRADGSPLVKVLDFGISKLVPRPGEVPPEAWQTKSRGVMGSPLYLSPEQMRAPKTVDARADIWALGAILYELVTGSTPFFGETVPEICAAILDMALVPASRLRPDLPPAFDAAIGRMLEKDMNRRFATLAGVAEALGPLAGPRAQLSVERIVGVIRGGAHTPPPSSGVPSTSKPKVIIAGPVSRPNDETRAAPEGEAEDEPASAPLQPPAGEPARPGPSVTLLTGERNLVRSNPAPLLLGAAVGLVIASVVGWRIVVGTRAPTTMPTTMQEGTPTPTATATPSATSTSTSTPTATATATATAASSSSFPTVAASALPIVKPTPVHGEPRVAPPTPPPAPPPSASTRHPDTAGFGKGMQ